MATKPQVPNAPLVPLPATFILLPLEVRHMIYRYLVLEVDIHVAANSSPVAPRYRRVYSGDLVTLANFNTFLRREVLSLRDTYDVVARTAVNVDMRALINSISTVQFHNLVQLEMQLVMGNGQLPFHSFHPYHVVRYAPASFGSHMTKLRRLTFVLTGGWMTVWDALTDMYIFSWDVVAFHPVLTDFDGAFDPATGTATFIFS